MPTANGALEFDENADGDVRRRRLPGLAEKLSVPNRNLFRSRTKLTGAVGDWRSVDAETSQNISKSYESLWTFGLLRTGPSQFLYSLNGTAVRPSRHLG